MFEKTFNEGTVNESKVSIATYRFWGSETGEPPLTSDDAIGIELPRTCAFLSLEDAELLREALTVSINNLKAGEIDDEVGALTEEEKTQGEWTHGLRADGAVDPSTLKTS